MKKTMKNILKIIVIIIVAISAMLLVRFAWAKYISMVEGNASADIAHFSFYVSEKSSGSLAIDLASTRIPRNTGNIDGTTVAPGTKGALAFDINADTSEVSIEYDIDIDITEVPPNLIFYYDEEMTNAIYHHNDNININGFFDKDASNKSTTRTIYWYWPLETGQSKEQIDINDEIDSRSMGKLITVYIKTAGQQVRVNPTENQHTVTLNANGGMINGYGNSEIVTKIAKDEQCGELPITQKEGCTFKGWYTDKTAGEQVLASTLVEDDVTYYAQWIPNRYTLTIDPNGGTYRSQITSTQVTRDYGNLLGLEEPTREGYTFAGWSIDGKGSILRGIPSGGQFKAISDMTVKEIIDTDGSIYNKYTVNHVNNNDTNLHYAAIWWPSYEYEPDHEYRVSAYIRANEIELNYIQLRHSAFEHDYTTPGFKVVAIKQSSDFIEYTMTRTFSTQETMDYNVSPRIELYCAITPRSTGILDMDIKNISVYDVTAGKYVTDGAYAGYMYKYGSGNATLTANWVKNN